MTVEIGPEGLIIKFRGKPFGYIDMEKERFIRYDSLDSRSKPPL